MGKRKLRFDARKIFECKKYRKFSGLTVSIPLEHVCASTNDADQSELIISLLLSAYMSATLPDATVLHSRLSRVSALPAGWTLACLPASTSHLATFAICKLQIFPPLCSAHVTFMLTVTPDCTWTLCVGQSPINQQQCRFLNGIAAKLCSVNEVVKLLSALDDSKHCVGNPETKFMQLVPRQKGIFRDQSGKSLSVHC